ncbi:MAG: S41 family peptidase [Myxococcota bacterium]|nr:S41 family peptidase [Myxococcota bacterium]
MPLGTHWLRAAACLLVALGTLGAAPSANAALTCTALPEFVRLFLRSHVRYHELSPEVRERAIENFVVNLDGSRTLLTEPEAERLRISLAGIFEDMKKGRCEKLTDAQKEIRRGHERAALFVRDTVNAEGYGIDDSASIVLDPTERGYPGDAAAREELLESLVHFQMSNYVSNDTALDEAKEKLVARYERRLRRALEVKPDETYATFLDAFASALDPHSNYLSAQVLEDFRIGMSLSLEGIGVALSEQDGYAVAERIIPGGAADKHGVLRPKDKLIAVAQDGNDFVDIVDMPLRDAVSLIRGKAGSKVGLTVLRQGESTEKFNIEIVRDKIDLAEQAASLEFVEREVDGEKLKLAVLELPSFYGDADPSKRQCTQDVAELLQQVNEAEADGLLLDLSRNGGGLLQHAVAISGFFIRKGEIVGIEDAQGRRQILPDRDDRVLYSGPMVVHTSRVSASASEILAGALKDYGRAVIVGDDHTFGKGTVQTVSQLPGDNGALKITTALFFRPGGMSTQHAGVEADVVLPSALASDDYGEKTQRFSLPPQRTSPFLGDSANTKRPAEHWDPVQNDLIVLLSERSQSRVSVSEAFDEVREQIAEAEERNGVVVVADLMERRKKEALEAGEDEEAGEETAAASAEAEDEAESLAEVKTEADEASDESTPQRDEALAVLTDLVTLSQQRAAAHEAARPES